MGRRSILKAIVVLLLSVPWTWVNTYAQVLKGTVYNADNNKPIPSASIYFAGTFKGTNTDTLGNFTISTAGIDPQIPLTVSSVGFITERVTDHQKTGLKIYLKRQLTELSEVVIDGMPRDEKLKLFKTAFLGNTPNGRNCTILNEDNLQLSYSKKNNTLKARCNGPLVIYNKNLGYTITYFLDRFLSNGQNTLFLGNYFFKEDPAASNTDAIKKKRERAYLGSRMHFVRSLWSNVLAENNFMVTDSIGNPLNYTNLVKTGQEGKFWAYNGKVAIRYVNIYSSSTVTKTQLQPVYIDSSGYYDAAGLLWAGNMSIQRIGDMLPFEYNSINDRKTKDQLSPMPQISAKEKTALIDDHEALAANNAAAIPYLQTDKGIYFTGEDIWFKLYLLDDRSFTPISDRTLYLQLIATSNNKPVLQEKYFIDKGTCNGHLFLNDAIANGEYVLAAYTAHSYFDTPGEFRSFKKIIVKRASELQKSKNEVAAQLPAPAKQDSKPAKIHLNIFPEGGYMVSGISNLVAFETTDKNGVPVDAAGTCYEDAEPLCDLKTIHNGMGSFTISPKPNKKYTIRLKGLVTDTVYRIPDIRPEGVVMHLVENKKDRLTFNILQASGKLPQQVFLRTQVHGKVYSLAKGILKDSLRVSFALAKYPQGISEVTLFNSALQPLAERLVYVAPEKKLYIQTSMTKNTYSPREKVTLQLKVTDENGLPVSANIGLSVYQGDRRLWRADNLLTHYYLLTELNGNIPDPTYYFNANNTDREETLDLLMLTHGWRRYNWNALVLPVNAPKLVISDQISGRLLRSDTKSEQYPMLFTPRNKSYNNILKTDTTGRFAIEPADMLAATGGYLYIKPVTPSGAGSKLEITDAFESIERTRKTKTMVYDADPITDNKQDEQIRINGITYLNEVSIKGKGKRQYSDRYIGDLDSLLRNEFTTDYVTHRGKDGKGGILNCPACANSPDKTLPVDGETYRVLKDVDMNSINKNAGTHVIYKGAELVVYHAPKLTDEELMKLYHLTRVKGYYSNKEFYQPNDNDLQANAMPDYRNTLTWQPTVITNADGIATVSFFCSDINGMFYGNIEGISADGELGVANFNITVTGAK